MAVRSIVRKKAALCLLRLLRKTPPDQVSRQKQLARQLYTIEKRSSSASKQ